MVVAGQAVLGLSVIAFAAQGIGPRSLTTHTSRLPAEPVRLALSDIAGRFEVEVTDTSGHGTGSRPGGRGGGDGAGLPAGFGIAVIAGLAEEVEISETPTGTSIRMSWPSAGRPG